MATAEQELVLTQTGPNTPLGNLLRRYWLPFAVNADFTGSRCVLPVRILSESLVLFRDAHGRAGLIQERCPHGGYPMALGTVGEAGIVCARHGWRFDVEGNCSVVGYAGKVYPMAWARARAYPVLGYAGFYWAYLGPPPAPALPNYDVLARPDGRRRITVYPIVESNWLTAVSRLLSAASPPGATAAGPITLPASLGSAALWLHIPIDDRQTWQAAVEFLPAADGAAVDPADEEPEVVRAQQAPTAGGNVIGEDVPNGSVAAWSAHLLREIERVQQGQDPLGVIRDPSRPMIVTGLI